MNVALLAPATLAAGILLGVTVFAHLQRRPPRETRAFGAMMLLERLPPRLTRRTRLHDRVLLLLRLLALGLVVLAAARPELRRQEAPSTIGASGRVVVIVDTSLSMQAREGSDPAFSAARRAAVEEVRGLPNGVEVALVTAGAPASTRAGWTTDAAGVAAIIEDLVPSHGSTDLRGALTLARGLMSGSAAEVVVYTDEAGPGVVESCAGDLERILALGGAVIPRRFAPVTPENVAPVEASYGDGIEGGTVRVKLASWGSRAREVAATVALPDGATMTAFVDVPAATAEGPGVAEEVYTVPRQAAGGIAEVRVDDAGLAEDDTLAFHLPQVGASRVLVVDGDPGSTPTKSEVYFLERALAPAPGVGVAVDVVAATSPASLDPARHRVVFMANVADPAPWATRLVEFVRGGGGLVIAMGDNVTPERWNAPLAALLPAPLRGTRDLVDLDGQGGSPLARFDSASTYLKPFARTGLSGFQRTRARRVMTIEPGPEEAGTRVVAHWEGGLPALLEREVGTGRVLVWTGSLDLGWGNLPIQSIFMPFVQRVVGVLGGAGAGALALRQGVVGEPLEVELPGDPGSVEVTGPGGGVVPSERAGRSLRVVPTLPGAYHVRAADGRELVAVAVRTPSAESDIRRGQGLVEAQARLAPERMTRRWPLAAWGFGAAALLWLASAWIGRGRSDDA